METVGTVTVTGTADTGTATAAPEVKAPEVKAPAGKGKGKGNGSAHTVKVGPAAPVVVFRLSKWGTEQVPELAQAVKGIPVASAGVQYNQYTGTPAQAKAARLAIIKATAHYTKLSTAKDGPGRSGLTMETILWRLMVTESATKRMVKHLGPLV
jgi:hypothetical protein